MFNIMEHYLLYNALLHHMIRVTRPHTVQRWIEATIYNDESSKSKRCVNEHNTVLCNLGYRGEPKVFIEIQRNHYSTYHVNRCVEVEHGRNSTECQKMSNIDN